MSVVIVAPPAIAVNMPSALKKVPGDRAIKIRPSYEYATYAYSTVTLFARLRGWSTSVPSATAVW